VAALQRAHSVGLVESDAFLAMSGHCGQARAHACSQYAEGYVRARRLRALHRRVRWASRRPRGSPLDAARRLRARGRLVLPHLRGRLPARAPGRLRSRARWTFRSSTEASPMRSWAWPQKLARGEVIPSDDFSTGAQELECIVDMAVAH
jgi:hypothetical protein